MIADITRDGTYVTPQIDSLTVEGAARSRAMSAGSVVMAVSGAVGLPAILRSDSCIHDGFVGFRALSSDVLPIFFYYALFLRQAANKSQAAGAIWQNLTTDQVNDWSISVLSLPHQQKFAALVERVELLRAIQREAY
jgi:type I restriction enzyme, S subunit